MVDVSTQSGALPWASEFERRLPAILTWMAGGGLKPGFAYGQTDDIGRKAAINRVHWNDFHATILHLLGIDHKRLTYYHNGIQRRLTNVAGEVVQGVLL